MPRHDEWGSRCRNERTGRWMSAHACKLRKQKAKKRRR